MSDSANDKMSVLGILTSGEDSHLQEYKSTVTEIYSSDENLQAELFSSELIAPNKPVYLRTQLQDSQGNAIVQFDWLCEKLMHLIMVSDDLHSFSHLYPTYKSDGCFDVKARFLKSGRHTLFSHYKPTDQPEALSVLKVNVPGSTSLSSPIVDFSSTQSIENTSVKLCISERTDNLGEGLTLTFRLRDKTTKVPIQDLQPHLGNWAYLVMIHRSSNLAREDYIYAYAIKGEMPGQLKVITRVPKLGQYKLWLQFRQNDRVLVAEFWLNFVKKLDLGN